jgi:hypothetical protein
VLARAVAQNNVEKCLADLNGFGFSKVEKLNDPMLLPGALKYGGIGGLAALAVPLEMLLYGMDGVPQEEIQGLFAVNKAASGKLSLIQSSLTDEKAVDYLLK